MEGETRRSFTTGLNPLEGPREERRPYARPSVKTFGRKLPAFAPPSPPPPPGTNPFNR